MGYNRFTYANNSRRVQPPGQIYLVGLPAQRGDLALTLLQTRGLRSKVARSAVHRQLKSLKKQVFTPESGSFPDSCTAIASQVADAVGSVSDNVI